MNVNYPVDCTTNQEKLSFLHRQSALLRDEHNAKGVEKNAETLTQAEWDAYYKDTFMPKTHAIGAEMSIQKKAAQDDSTTWPDADPVKDIT